MPWHLSSQVSQVALVVKNLPARAEGTRDMGSVPESGRSPREGHGNPLQYSCLENSVDRGAWWATAHRAMERGTWLTKHRLFIISGQSVSGIRTVTAVHRASEWIFQTGKTLVLRTALFSCKSWVYWERKDFLRSQRPRAWRTQNTELIPKGAERKGSHEVCGIVFLFCFFLLRRRW